MKHFPAKAASEENGASGENEQLEQTVSWMHDLIWELTRRLHITQSR